MTGCPYTRASPDPLPLDAFRHLHKDGRRLIQAWFWRAHDRRACCPADSFEPFIFAWIAFNGWSSCVTGEDLDGEMVRRTANCPALRADFAALTSSDAPFAAQVDRFADLWPVFKGQQVRQHGYYSAPSNRRDEVVKEYMNHGGIDYAPKCAGFHRNRGELIPQDWPHTLHTIYRVRCNLFHGEKSPHSEMDAGIVKAAFDVLVAFMEKVINIQPTKPNMAYGAPQGRADAP